MIRRTHDLIELIVAVTCMYITYTVFHGLNYLENGNQLEKKKSENMSIRR